jgi:hypothetical protein
MMRIDVKILGHKTSQRYAVRRAVVAAQTVLLQEHPDLMVEIEEVREREEIEKITLVIIYPSLVIDGRLVCVGRFPKKDEILAWFNQALKTV